MRVIEARNVNDALVKGIRILRVAGGEQDSRAGDTLEFPGPVATVYSRPDERVLWSPERRANPFFHFFEAMWMLAGRDDVAFVAGLLPRMADYSDDGVHMQGAYGYRWRRHFGMDQLSAIIAELLERPASRRAVLAMWDPADLRDRPLSKDIPCNTTIYFKVRQGYLHMMVCNRSNDILWGAYGANYVHMGFLQEYIANKLKVRVGEYTQMSDSYHVYLGGPGGKVWERVRGLELGEDYYRSAHPGDGEVYTPFPMMAHTPEWDADCQRFFSMLDHGVVPSAGEFDTVWWRSVVVPYWRAFYFKDDIQLVDCLAQDWRVAGYRWFAQQKDK